MSAAIRTKLRAVSFKGKGHRPGISRRDILECSAMFRFELRARGRPSRKGHLAEPSIADSLPDITYRAVVEGQRWVGGQAKT